MKKRTAVLAVASITVLIGIAGLVWWMDRQCHVPIGRAAIKATNSIGCFDFWANRYQTLLIGVPSIVFAWWAAIALVKQLRALTHQNNIATAALEWSRAEVTAQQRTNIAALIDLIDDTVDEIFAVVPFDTKLFEEELGAEKLDQAEEVISSKRKNLRAGVLAAIDTREGWRLFTAFDDHIQTAFSPIVEEEYARDDPDGGIVMSVIPRDPREVLNEITQALHKLNALRKLCVNLVETKLA